jgi:predicted ATPase/DNA-binding SARP family transcriptional activator
VHVLGPVAVQAGELPVPLDRPLERALVARLALARGMPVPDERLARDLWGSADLARPTQRLRVLASRLRRSLGGYGGALTRAGGGYVLAAWPADLAAAEAAADRLYAAARAGASGPARAAAAEALGGWRGPALADLRGVPYAAREGERLDGWRLDLLVERLAADLALGAAAEVSAELESLAGEHPLHERLCGLLALALYRGGRQAEALDRLARLRRALAEELGVDPGPELAALELRLLRQDPSLSAPAAPVSGAPVSGDARDRTAVSPDTTRSPGPPALPLPLPAQDLPAQDLPAQDLPAQDLPAQDLPAPRLPVLRLPVPATSFVGRGADLAVLTGRLAAPGLVTLTGGPGSGKTRLALELARAVQAGGRPVALVELAALAAAAVPAALAEAAGVEDGPGDPLPRCAAALAGALLLLDNAEHLVEAAAGVVAALLRRAELTVLVTSQRPLLVAEEEVHRLGPLDPADAARLFRDRSNAAAPPDATAPGVSGTGVSGTDASGTDASGTDADGPDADASAVEAVCAAVDRLPLGVELAAGLARTLSVRQLADRLGDRLRLLVGGSRDAGARHTSLRAALDWSHDLLDGTAQVVLRRLAVFAGGFGLEAAERVAAAGPVNAADLAPVLADLADRCLLTVGGADPAGARRFGLLATVRAYAADRLRAAGEEGATRDRHLAWCLAYAGEHDVRGRGRGRGAGGRLRRVAQHARRAGARAGHRPRRRRAPAGARPGRRVDGTRPVPGGPAALRGAGRRGRSHHPGTGPGAEQLRPGHRAGRRGRAGRRAVGPGRRAGRGGRRG